MYRNRNGNSGLVVYYKDSSFTVLYKKSKYPKLMFCKMQKPGYDLQQYLRICTCLYDHYYFAPVIPVLISIDCCKCFPGLKNSNTFNSMGHIIERLRYLRNN